MKTPTGHTTGPWHVAPRHKMSTKIGIGNGACHIAFVSITACVRPPEAEANARLIAAAPELLEALIACEDRLRCFADDRQTAQEPLRKARAAIAKAKGQP